MAVPLASSARRYDAMGKAPKIVLLEEHRSIVDGPTGDESMGKYFDRTVTHRASARDEEPSSPRRRSAPPRSGPRPRSPPQASSSAARSRHCVPPPPWSLFNASVSTNCCRLDPLTSVSKVRDWPLSTRVSAILLSVSQPPPQEQPHASLPIADTALDGTVIPSAAEGSRRPFPLPSGSCQAP